MTLIFENCTIDGQHVPYLEIGGKNTKADYIIEPRSRPAYVAQEPEAKATYVDLDVQEHSPAKREIDQRSFMFGMLYMWAGMFGLFLLACYLGTIFFPNATITFTP
jgi:hypothetical protein